MEALVILSLKPEEVACWEIDNAVARQDPRVAVAQMALIELKNMKASSERLRRASLAPRSHIILVGN